MSGLRSFLIIPQLLSQVLSIIDKALTEQKIKTAAKNEVEVEGLREEVEKLKKDAEIEKSLSATVDDLGKWLRGEKPPPRH